MSQHPNGIVEGGDPALQAWVDSLDPKVIEQREQEIRRGEYVSWESLRDELLRRAPGDTEEPGT